MLPRLDLKKFADLLEMRAERPTVIQPGESYKKTKNDTRAVFRSEEQLSKFLVQVSWTCVFSGIFFQSQLIFADGLAKMTFCF